MDTPTLKQWAQLHGEGDVADHPDRSLSLTSKLLRFRWNGAPAVAVGSDQSKTRINAVLDGVIWFLASAQPGDDTLHLVLGAHDAADAAGVSLKEHRDAIGTLIANMQDGPIVRVWTLEKDSDAIEIETKLATFTTDTPERWSALLMSKRAQDAPVSGLAADLISAVRHPSIALYPKLSSKDLAQPWQLRLDGVEVGRAGVAAATLRLDSQDLDRPREPRETWLRVIGSAPIAFDAGSLPGAVTLIRQLIDEWSDHDRPGAALRHGHPEHALETHVLSGRLTLVATDGALRVAIPIGDGALRAAQFPTLWGDVSRPARYLDALLADEHARPWAIELKDQDAGGGHGAYLRHGIGQAVLYRHYIRSAPALDDWFIDLGLHRRECQAALAFPTPTVAAATAIASHRDLARRFGVEVIAFRRPGSAAT
jgi:hypothetical protein